MSATRAGWVALCVAWSVVWGVLGLVFFWVGGLLLLPLAVASAAAVLLPVGRPATARGPVMVDRQEARTRAELGGRSSIYQHPRSR